MSTFMITATSDTTGDTHTWTAISASVNGSILFITEPCGTEFGIDGNNFTVDITPTDNTHA